MRLYKEQILYHDLKALQMKSCSSTNCYVLFLVLHILLYTGMHCLLILFTRCLTILEKSLFHNTDFSLQRLVAVNVPFMEVFCRSLKLFFNCCDTQWIALLFHILRTYLFARVAACVCKNCCIRTLIAFV